MAIKGEVVRYWNVFKRIIVISLTLLAVIGAHAQYDPVFSHYWLMETSYNPLQRERVTNSMPWAPTQWASRATRAVPRRSM